MAIMGWNPAVAEEGPEEARSGTRYTGFIFTVWVKRFLSVRSAL